MAAQQALFHEVETSWPDGRPGAVRMLAGEGKSPSLVWHAQAIAVLLELGFLPTARCVREHLAVIERRLQPINCHDPEQSDEKDPWLLRTRHVAWIVACLAEMPRIELAPGEASSFRDELTAAIDQHRRIVTTAATYLLGVGDGEPAAWTGPRDSLWTEVWKEREPNLLNTLYATLALCRAERHGYLGDLVPPRPGRVSWATELFEDLLINGVVVETSRRGPTVRWRQDWRLRWREPWARSANLELPDGVIGLLTLALLEYASLLQEASEPGTEEELRSISARTLARRLAQVLVFRGVDRSSSGRARWMTTADAFFSEKSEGAWFVPSYSVCVRAILESGIVDPRASIVRDAFTTIDSLGIARRHRDRLINTWLDPTRDPQMRDEKGAYPQHRAADFSSLLGNPRRGRVNAAGLHAAVMAYAALRRRTARVDPRDLLQVPDEKRPASLFERIELQPGAPNGDWYVNLISGGGRFSYREQTELSERAAIFVRALGGFDEPATAAEIIAAARDLAGTTTTLTTPGSVENRVNRLNRQLGAQLIEWFTEEGEKAYFLDARVRVV